MRTKDRLLLEMLLVLGLGACEQREDVAPPAEPATAPVAQRQDPQQRERSGPAGDSQTGTATVYAGVLEGEETATGEIFNHDELVAAHPNYPVGTQVRVTNLDNQRAVVVRVADRIPAGTAREGVVIDLSRRAAREIGIDEQGQAQVRIEVLE